MTRLKTNTVVILEDNRYRVSSIGKHIGNLHYYRPLDCYIGSVEVVYPKVGRVQLAVVKKDPHPEPGRIKYLVTSDLSLTNAEVVRRYRSRWTIECFFRALKQLCGVGDCPSRLQVCVERHFALSCLAFVCLELIRNGRPEMSREQVSEQLKRYTTVTVGDTPLVVSIDGICTPAAEDPPLTALGLPEVSETSIKQLLGKTA